jgi:hypothetical protein
MLGRRLAGITAIGADALTKDLKELFRVGRYSLCVGVVVLAACITSGRLILRSPCLAVGTLLNEGWSSLDGVANWRPIEIFSVRLVADHSARNISEAPERPNRIARISSRGSRNQRFGMTYTCPMHPQIPGINRPIVLSAAWRLKTVGCH